MLILKIMRLELRDAPLPYMSGIKAFKAVRHQLAVSVQVVHICTPNAVDNDTSLVLFCAKKNVYIGN